MHRDRRPFRSPHQADGSSHWRRRRDTVPVELRAERRSETDSSSADLNAGGDLLPSFSWAVSRTARASRSPALELARAGSSHDRGRDRREACPDRSASAGPSGSVFSGQACCSAWSRRRTGARAGRTMTDTLFHPQRPCQAESSPGLANVRSGNHGGSTRGFAELRGRCRWRSDRCGPDHASA